MTFLPGNVPLKHSPLKPEEIKALLSKVMERYDEGRCDYSCGSSRLINLGPDLVPVRSNPTHRTKPLLVTVARN